MSDYEKTLIGMSIPLDEVDDEESNLDVIIPEAEINADFLSLIESFGTDEFKPLYLNLYHTIRDWDLEIRREFCEKLVEKIYDIYEFEFIPNLVFVDENVIEDFLKLIEFLNYDYLDFLTKIISGLDLILLKKDLDSFLKENWKYLKISSYQSNEIISKFIRTNNKRSLYSFLKEKLEKDKMLVILTILEGEL